MWFLRQVFHILYMMKTIAIDIRQWKWKFDRSGMLCSNEENKVVVKITKGENGISGKIIDISMELFYQIAAHKNGPKIIQQIVFSAENEYCKVCKL